MRYFYPILMTLKDIAFLWALFRLTREWRRAQRHSVVLAHTLERVLILARNNPVNPAPDLSASECPGA